MNLEKLYNKNKQDDIKKYIINNSRSIKRTKGLSPNINVNEIVNKFHEMSDELTRQSENVQKYADSISLSIKESTEGIQLAASNTDNLSSEITNIASKIGTNKEVANVLEKEADRFIIA